MNNIDKRRAPTRAWVVYLFALVALAHAGTSAAMHENDHRFTIFGQVNDVAGKPVEGAEIRITGLAGQPLAELRTDAMGRYSITLHVHTPQRGQPFWVAVGRTVFKGAFEFDPNDATTVRRYQVNLEIPQSS